MKIRSKIQLIGSLNENKIKPHLEFFNERFLNESKIGLSDSVLLGLSLNELENKIFDNSFGAATARTVLAKDFFRWYCP